MFSYVGYGVVFCVTEARSCQRSLPSYVWHTMRTPDAAWRFNRVCPGIHSYKMWSFAYLSGLHRQGSGSIVGLPCAYSNPNGRLKSPSLRPYQSWVQAGRKRLPCTLQSKGWWCKRPAIEECYTEGILSQENAKQESLCREVKFGITRRTRPSKCPQIENDTSRCVLQQRTFLSVGFQQSGSWHRIVWKVKRCWRRVINVFHTVSRKSSTTIRTWHRILPNI